MVKVNACNKVILTNQFSNTRLELPELWFFVHCPIFRNSNFFCSYYKKRINLLTHLDKKQNSKLEESAEFHGKEKKNKPKAIENKKCDYCQGLVKHRIGQANSCEIYGKFITKTTAEYQCKLCSKGRRPLLNQKGDSYWVNYLSRN